VLKRVTRQKPELQYNHALLAMQKPDNCSAQLRRCQNWSKTNQNFVQGSTILVQLSEKKIVMYPIKR